MPVMPACRRRHLERSSSQPHGVAGREPDRDPGASCLCRSPERTRGDDILDVSDPRKPKIVGRLMVPNELTHTHKVRVVGDLDHEFQHQPGSGRRNEFKDVGFRIYDIGDPANPRLVTFVPTFGKASTVSISMRATPISPPRWRGLSAIFSSFTTSAIPHVRSKSRAGGCRAERGRGEPPHPKGIEHRLHHAALRRPDLCGLLGLGCRHHRRLRHRPSPP